MMSTSPPSPADGPTSPATESPPQPAAHNGGQASTRASRNRDRIEALRLWLKLIAQPLLLLAAGVVLLFGLGIAQRWGILSSGGPASQPTEISAGKPARYMCPMMCTPPQAEPGRCPVCAMELVPAASTPGEQTDSRSVTIAPAARRVANIETVPVRAVAATRIIRAIGELTYDEGSLKTISAYVDGRLERLYADYTGVVVRAGDHLAELYSPRLYSSQVEFLLAKQARQEGRSATLERVIQSNAELYESSRQRLVELGMTEPQIKRLEQDGRANSRMHLAAPISGTVIEKLAVEGQYVKEGQPIYKLADLSTVWLILRLFPEDAASVRYGLRVQAEVQSLTGRKFTGRVAFINPHVDPQTRTVGVRVVISNEQGHLRIGDYAKATMAVPIDADRHDRPPIYDPELVGKWISPRHPHVIESSPGNCRICGVDLVPATDFGFADRPTAKEATLVLPRNAVLMAGDHSVVYAETEPGRFELRQVVLGPSVGDQMVVLSGVQAGEQVAARGNFLIDSQMQLAGNPSLIDPNQAEAEFDPPTSSRLAALEELNEADRAAAQRQGTCPVGGARLGAMGPPLKVEVQGRAVFICCVPCRHKLLAEPDKYLAELAGRSSEAGAAQAKMDLPPIGRFQLVEPAAAETPAKADERAASIEAALAKLPPDDHPQAVRQRICPVAELQLGSHGTPVKVEVVGRTVFICCEACRDRLLAEPEKHLAKLSRGEPR